jgi:hypothetical protein
VTHHGPVALVEAELLAALLVGAAVVYVAAARGAAWPVGRTVRWLLGIGTAVAGVAVWSLGGAHDLRLHVVGHLLLGMVAPLLLVTAAPVTLALRALPREHARTLGRLLRRRPLAVLTHPVVAALLDVGGLWLMYRTALLSEVSPLLLQAHMLLAGYLFAVALIGPDPAPHRPRARRAGRRARGGRGRARRAREAALRHAAAGRTGGTGRGSGTAHVLRRGAGARRPVRPARPRVVGRAAPSPGTAAAVSGSGTAQRGSGGDRVLGRIAR